MINLLPAKQKEELLGQWRLRITSILGVVFLSFFISFFLVLFLVKSLISADSQTNEILLKEEMMIISSNQDKEAEISESNKILSDLRSFYNKNPDLTGVFEKIKENMPAGLYLTGFDLSFFAQTGKDFSKVSLSGFAGSRSSLEQFQQNLEQEDIFSEINFTPESWVNPEEFHISFELTEKE